MAKAKKSKMKKTTKKKAKKTVKPAKSRRAPAKSKKPAPAKTKKPAAKKKKQIIGEGDYVASNMFLKDGPEGASLKAAEQEAMSRSTIE